MFLASTEILNDKEAQINSFSMRIVLVAALLLVVFLLIAAKSMKKAPKVKLPLFLLIAATILVPTATLFASTIYLNVSSDSGGPIHWHTDVEFWVCDQEMELRNPSGFLSNKIGSPTFHEHNDKRLHLEGVVIDKEYDASLEKFMLLTGGKISSNELRLPVEEEFITAEADGDSSAGSPADISAMLEQDEDDKPVVAATNGKECGGVDSEVQAFVYRFSKDDNTYSQEKLADPARYVLRDESTVPPGDCLIVEFGPAKDRTDKLCLQYGVRDEKRCVLFGVSEPNPKLCNLREVTSEAGGAE